MARSKVDDPKQFPVQVMLNSEEKAIFERLLAVRRAEIESPELSGPALFRWLMLREAAARGLTPPPPTHETVHHVKHYSTLPPTRPAPRSSAFTPPAGTQISPSVPDSEQRTGQFDRAALRDAGHDDTPPPGSPPKSTKPSGRAPTKPPSAPGSKKR